MGSGLSRRKNADILATGEISARDAETADFDPISPPEDDDDPQELNTAAVQDFDAREMEGKEETERSVSEEKLDQECNQSGEGRDTIQDVECDQGAQNMDDQNKTELWKVSLGLPWQKLFPKYLYRDRVNQPPVKQPLLDTQLFSGCYEWEKKHKNLVDQHTRCEQDFPNCPVRVVKEVARPVVKLAPYKLHWVEVQHGPHESMWWREDCVKSAINLSRGTDRSIILHWHRGGSSVCSRMVFELLQAMVFCNPHATLNRSSRPQSYRGRRPKGCVVAPEVSSADAAKTMPGISANFPEKPALPLLPNMSDED